MKNMKTKIQKIILGKVTCAVAILLLFVALNIQAQYAYTILPFVSPIGISGDYVLGGNFIYNYVTQTYTYLNALDGTYVEGISGNNIVGFYNPGPGEEGFVYNISSQTFTTLNVPGVNYATFAFGIDGNNVAGYQYHPGQSYVYNITSQAYTAFARPGAETTYASGISGNYVVGQNYFYGVGFEGFLYNINNQTFNTLQFVPTGISGDNVIDGGDFIYNIASQAYTEFNFPGASSTSVNGIDDTDLVGTYRNSSGDNCGFLAVPVPEPGFFALLAACAGAFSLWHRRK